MTTAGCKYPECGVEAEFDCTCHGEGETEQKDLCGSHKELAETICSIFGWTLIVKALKLAVN